MTKPMFSLEGRVALVTGSNRGIGRAIAVAFARHGADLVLGARDPAALLTVRKEVESFGRRAVPVALDVTSADQVEAAVQQAVTVFGRLDILVNNAGARGAGPIEEMKEEDWDRVLDTNLKGAFLTCRAAVPVMKAQRYGRIIHIASVSGQSGGLAGSADYAASKGGMLAMTKSMGRDLGPWGITVNAIAPGQIETEMGTPRDPDRMRRVLEQTPVGRLGRPEEIAAGAVFLASEEAAFMTAACLDINGGINRR